MKRILFFAVLAMSASACAPDPLEPRPLDIELTATPATVAVGDTVTFVINAQGGSLLGVQIFYGDNTNEVFGTAGANTARVTFRHAYTARGTYNVRATVNDFRAGEKEATTQVRVN